jgi:23S rRNA (cytidine1920-2'-O)/16S rRNA (cytidine1409-2'-O)-methyltransferase
VGEKKVRADLLLVERGLAPTREKARALIMAGVVKAGGKRVAKPGDFLSPSVEISIEEPMPFVGRGGLKLAPALEAFKIDCRDKICLDIGCSTGGFTDCLLQRGARKVYAVDVNINQLDIKLRKDPRVVAMEKNARYLSPRDFPETPDIITMDISFISVLKVLPALHDILKEGVLIALLKPQFEAGKGQVGKKGVIKSPEKHLEIISQVMDKAQALGFRPKALLASPIKGQRGNQEFFVLWQKGGHPLSREEIMAMVSEVVYGQKN